MARNFCPSAPRHRGRFLGSGRPESRARRKAVKSRISQEIRETRHSHSRLYIMHFKRERLRREGAFYAPGETTRSFEIASRKFSFSREFLQNSFGTDLHLRSPPSPLSLSRWCLKRLSFPRFAPKLCRGTFLDSSLLELIVARRGKEGRGADNNPPRARETSATIKRAVRCTLAI